jgi:cation transport ATPase
MNKNTDKYYQETVYKLKKMDCPSEEQMVRMALADVPEIVNLVFDLEQRTVKVITEIIYANNADNSETIHTLSDIYKDSKKSKIPEKLKNLGFGYEVISTDRVNATFNNRNNQQKEKRVLITVLLINFSFFLIEMSLGLVGNSLGLISDSLDMFADSVVYALALIVIGSALKMKKSITRIAAVFQAFLALFGFAEAMRRFFMVGDMPDFRLMIIVSSCALIANVICFYMLHKLRSDEIHMKASVIFSLDDVIVNLGVIIAGVLVLVTNTEYPDLIAAAVVFSIVAGLSIKLWNMSK